METKKRVAAVCMLLLLMLSGQRQLQVAAKPALPFWECYQECMFFAPWCRHATPWWLCNVGCAGKCYDGNKEDILDTCRDFVCELDDADGFQDCLRECMKRLGNN